MMIHLRIHHVTVDAIAVAVALDQIQQWNSPLNI